MCGWTAPTSAGTKEGRPPSPSTSPRRWATVAALTVRAEDDPHDPSIPRGKQDWHEQPHSIWYHRVTGIWRSVWLEVVPDLHVVDAVWTTDLAAARITGAITLSRSADASVEVLASLEGATLGRVRIDTATQTVVIDLPIAALRNGQALEEFVWSPEHPRLVDLAVTVSEGGMVADEVACYAGMRSVAVDEHCLMLNERPLFLRSVLHQGYWPATHFTPPSPEAIREEVELILRLGFNSVRIHQKTEDARFLYWCDRLGLTVWLEAASAVNSALVLWSATPPTGCGSCTRTALTRASSRGCPSTSHGGSSTSPGIGASSRTPAGWRSSLAL